LILQILYILCPLVLFAVSMLLYYKRKLERASDPFVFGFMNPFISYIIAFFGMSLLGFYFSAAGYGYLYFYAGLLSGTIIFFLIGRMFVKKTFRIFNKGTAVNLGIYSLIACIFVSTFALDLTGYEKRIPHERNIEGFTISYSPYFNYSSDYSGIPVLSSPANIAAMRRFHQDILENYKDWSDFYPMYSSYCSIQYDLTGLFDMQRAYTLDYEFVKSSRALAEIYESEEHKSHSRMADPGFINNVSSISIYNSEVGRNFQATIIGRSNITEFLNCMDHDYKAQTHEEALSFVNTYAGISYDYIRPHPYETGRFISSAIPRTYKKTIEWLKKNGYSHQIEITPEMIAKITVIRNNWYYEDQVEITDKKQIAVVLDTFEHTLYASDSYEGRVFLDPEFALEFNVYESFYFYYSPQTVPDFVRDAFN